MSAAELDRLDGRVVVLTGASRGIGRAAADALSRLGATLVLPVRRTVDGERVAGEIEALGQSPRPDVVTMDLAVQASIRSGSAEILRGHPRIHVLINNAGIITRRRDLTPDGLETQFAVNHLGPFLLTALLLDALRRAAPSRVITVSSGAHAGARLDFDDLMGERRYDPTGAYSRSKLANILFTRELARRLAGTGVTANCLHPGVIATRLLSDYMGAPIGSAARLFGGSPAKGAETIVYLAASPAVAGTTGEYFERRKVVRPAAAAYDTDSARRLWEVSERLTAVST